MKKIPIWPGQIALLLTFLGLWEIVSSIEIISPVLLPRFSQTIVSISGVLASGELNYHLLITMEELLSSFLIAAVVGISVGFLIASTKLLRETFEPILLLLFAIPIAVVYPLIAVWFGLGVESKILFGSIYGFFPIATNTIAGVRSTDKSLMKMSKSMGASSPRIFTSVIFPSATPTLIAGLRSGLNLAFIGIIFGEMFASLGGLGFLINSASQVLDSAKVFGLIGIGLLVIVIANLAFNRLEIRSSRWRGEL